MRNEVNLDKVKNDYDDLISGVEKRIIICAGTGCVANGSLNVYEKFMEILTENNIKVSVELKPHEKKNGVYLSKSGCQGFCQMGPLVTIMPEKTMYLRVRVEDVEEIVEETILNNRIVERLVFKDKKSSKTYSKVDDIPFYKQQRRIVLKNCGYVDPENIFEYIHTGGYFSAQKVLKEMSDKDVCDKILASGLRGRGGGGFPTGRKWEMTRIQPGNKKYIICNGDEGDPGAFMDRSIMEGNPHSVIEGMIIAAKAVGADEGIVYVRTEYPLAVRRMKIAISDAGKAGILGKNILGSDFNFKISVMEGAGAFVCGEETALIASIEGKRGMPMPKPPFPAQSGLNGKPTVINNVETLSTVPVIFSMGIDRYSQIGTATSSGTKTFAVSGHVVNTGLIEVPFGTTLRQIVDEVAGGVVSDSGELCGTDFKAVQIGGPSGGCLTKEHLDLPIDYDTLKSVGAMVGSGGLVVMNKDTCMVSIARYFMEFTQNESCGKCVLCREGTKQMLTMLTDIVEGKADENTLEILEELAHAVKTGSLCGLGKTAPSPVLSTLKYFRDEYEAHVKQKVCPTGNCKDLSGMAILPERCKGCGLCAKKCPADAITGERGKPHMIDQDKCIKCGVCTSICKFDAVVNQ